MEDSGIDSDPKPVNHIEDERVFLGSDSSCSSNHTQTFQNSTTKQLQKKLEARIEQAKRIHCNSDYIKLQNYNKANATASDATSLISIQRLSIPRKKKDHLPLVEFCHSDSESDDERTVFPIAKEKGSTKHKQDITDTFSIEELSDESEDSLNLGPARASPELKFMKSYPRSVECCQCKCHIL